MLVLNLPSTDPVIKNTVETRPRAVADWLDTLPFASPMHVAQKLLMALYALNRHTLDDDDRFALLALYRPVVARAAASLEDLIADAGVPPHAQHRQIGALLRELQIEHGIGYKHVLQALANRRIVRPSAKRSAEAVARLLRALNDVQIACHLTHVPPPAGLWREIHQVHAFAQEAKLTQLAVDDAPTPALAYCQAVLVARADPPHMSHAELVHTRLYLEKFATLATLVAAPVNGHQGFGLRVDGDAAPAPLMAGPAPNSLWLDTDALCRHLQDTSLRLRTGDTPRQIGLPQGMESEISQSLCAYLQKQWCGDPQRAFRRHTPADSSVQLVAGLSAIHRLLNPDQLAPPSSVPDGTIDLSAPVAAAALAPPHAAIPSRWAVINDSAAGIALSSKPEDALNLKVGDPLALQSDDSTKWSLGVIRWIRMRDAHQVDLGIERLSPQIEPVWVRPLRGHRTSTPEPALYVPGIAALRQNDRLLLPRHLYQLGMDAEVSHPPRQYTISFGKRLDPTPSFDLIDFSLIAD